MKRAAKFVIALAVPVVAMTIVRDLIFPGRNCYCTDEVGFGFWLSSSGRVGDPDY